MPGKRKTTYFSKKAKGPLAPAREPIIPPSLAVIDTTAGRGRAGIVDGSRVRILGTGLYAGELAVVERLVPGVIPAAFVRTDAGGTRRVRTIDLEPVARGAENRSAETHEGEGADPA